LKGQACASTENFGFSPQLMTKKLSDELERARNEKGIGRARLLPSRKRQRIANGE